VQIEIPQKRVKTVVNVNLVNLLAQAMAAIQSLFSENEKNKYSQLLKRYIDLTKVSEVNSGVAIEGVPDSEIEKEIFQVDRLKETNDFNLVKYVQDSLYFTIQRILESKINFLKEKIKSGENVEENLKEIQNLTRLNMNSKKEIYG
jgi:flagellar motor component MotA